MNVLIVCEDGRCAALAHRLRMEGNEVLMEGPATPLLTPKRTPSAYRIEQIIRRFQPNLVIAGDDNHSELGKAFSVKVPTVYADWHKTTSRLGAAISGSLRNVLFWRGIAFGRVYAASDEAVFFRADQEVAIEFEDHGMVLAVYSGERSLGTAAGFSFPLVIAFLESIREPATEFFQWAAEKRLYSKRFTFRDSWSVALEYPGPVDINVVESGAERHIWPVGLAPVDGHLVQATPDTAMYITASGKSPRRAAQRCQRTLDRLGLPPGVLYGDAELVSLQERRSRPCTDLPSY